MGGQDEGVGFEVITIVGDHKHLMRLQSTVRATIWMTDVHVDS